MAKTGYGAVHFASLLKEETIYWLSACTTLKPGWQNDLSRYYEIQQPRNHYGRAENLLTAIRLSGSTDFVPAVKQFATVWDACPAIDHSRQDDQITQELDKLLSRPTQ
jgi:hypothetical protein